MDVEQRVREAIEAHDETRQSMFGGSGFSDWLIENGTVYVATTDHDNEPKLIAMPVAEFLAQWEVAEEDEE